MLKCILIVVHIDNGRSPSRPTALLGTVALGVLLSQKHCVLIRIIKEKVDVNTKGFLGLR